MKKWPYEDMYIVHLIPDKPEALSVRIDRVGWGHKTGLRIVDLILYMSRLSCGGGEIYKNVGG